MSDQLKDERAVFEAWAKEEEINLIRNAHDDGYAFPVARSSWKAWQACATTPPAAADAVAKDAGVGALVAKWLNKKADDYATEYGSDDMGSLSFGQGAHADAKRDYHSSLIELAEEALTAFPDTLPRASDAQQEPAFYISKTDLEFVKEMKLQSQCVLHSKPSKSRVACFAASPSAPLAADSAETAIRAKWIDPDSGDGSRRSNEHIASYNEAVEDCLDAVSAAVAAPTLTGQQAALSDEQIVDTGRSFPTLLELLSRKEARVQYVLSVRALLAAGAAPAQPKEAT